jgi:transposase
MGGGDLRTLLVVGATAAIRYAHISTAAGSAWIMKLLAKNPARLVSVALANKTARIVWALLSKGKVYRSTVVVTA